MTKCFHWFHRSFPIKKNSLLIVIDDYSRHSKDKLNQVHSTFYCDTQTAHDLLIFWPTTNCKSRCDAHNLSVLFKDHLLFPFLWVTFLICCNGIMMLDSAWIMMRECRDAHADILVGEMHTCWQQQWCLGSSVRCETDEAHNPNEWRVTWLCWGQLVFYYVLNNVPSNVYKLVIIVCSISCNNCDKSTNISVLQNLIIIAEKMVSNGTAYPLLLIVSFGSRVFWGVHFFVYGK